MIEGRDAKIERLLCRFGWHRWSWWSDATGYGCGYRRQERSCAGCNMAQARVFSP